MILVSEALEKYDSEHVAAKVVDKGRQRAGIEHLKRLLGDTALFDVDIPLCREYARMRHDEDDVVNATVRRELGILQAAANHCRRWKHATAQDMPIIELPEVAETEDAKWLTKDQIAQLFRACNRGRLACFIRILYYTGARRASIERLRKTQVDCNNGLIHLALPGEKKTKKRRPTVPLYPEIRPAVQYLFDTSGTEYLFGMNRDYYKPFVKLCADEGIVAYPHMMRHSRATHMLMDGEPIYKVAKLLGDSVATIERVYGHHSTGFLATGSGVGGGEIRA